MFKRKDNTVKIKIKRLTETAKLPTKAHESDACFDLYVDIPDNIETGIKIRPGETVKLSSGIATEIPHGYFAAIFPRSGLGINKNLRLPNCTGIIDSDYRGEWVISLINDGKVNRTIYHGDRVAQFTILPIPKVKIEEVKELNDTERGSGGLGSTGNR